MPYIKIELTREGVTREQKQALIKGVTDLMTETLNKDPHLTHVVIQEVDLDDWATPANRFQYYGKKALQPIKNNNHEKTHSHCHRCLIWHR
jgi:4-oxalocrotonate tautomerase